MGRSLALLAAAQLSCGGGDWAVKSRFMLDMRDRYNAWITFPVNLTDVNPGLRLYPETRAFFKRLCAAGAI